MSRRLHHAHVAPGRGEHVPVANPLGTESLRGVKGADRRAGQLSEPRCPGRVIGMPVGQHDQCHPAIPRDRNDPPQMALVLRPGIDYQHS
jgi:hypothetical protein